MALGKGLESLLSSDFLDEEVAESKLRTVKRVQVKPNPNQPRKEFNQAKLEELAKSIKNYGILEPLIVEEKNGHYFIIAGERRWRAANLAGLDEIPVIVMDDYENSLEISIIENLQREDLNVIELAHGYKALIDHYHYTHEELADKLGVTRSSVTNVLRLLKLSDKVVDLVKKNELSYGQSRALLAVPDTKAQEELANEIKNKKLSVREAERLVKRKLKEKESPTETIKEEESVFTDNLTTWLEEHFDAKVLIKESKGKGKLEFRFNSKDQLEQIVHSLGFKDKII